MRVVKYGGANETVIAWENTGKGGENILLISYETAVAAFIPGFGLAYTEKKHSATTTRHINKFLKHHALDHRLGVAMPQDVMDQLEMEIS